MLLFQVLKCFVNSCDSCEAAAISPNGTNTFLINDFGTLFINVRPTFINYSRSVARNLLDSVILDKRVFDNFIFSDGLFAKALRRPVTCTSVNDKLREKLFSVVSIMSNDNLICLMISLELHQSHFLL